MPQNHKASDTSHIIRSAKIMADDLSLAPNIYKPSRFWEHLGEKHKSVLETKGYENFKRTVNQHYFQWLVTSFRNEQFVSVIKQLVKYCMKNKKLPFNKEEILFKASDFTFYNKKTNQSIRLPFIQRYIYKYFIYFLYLYTKTTDQLHLFKIVQEPLFGNPLTLTIHKKKISQDLCNSIRETNRIIVDGNVEQNQRINIAEIGAGYGRVAFTFLSYFRNARYIIVDIPPALAIAQTYLTHCFSKKKIFTYRSFSHYNQVQKELEESDIIFLLPHQLELFPDKYFDIIINISSFHEMRREQIHHWFDVVNRLCKGTFYIKEWLAYNNRHDNIIIPCVDYPFRPEWEIVSFNIDAIQPKFFEACYHISP